MLKKKDLLFLAWLRTNSRESLTTISRKTNIPVSTLFDRLKAQEGKIIKKHTTIIDFEKMGYNCRAKVVLRLDKKDREPAREHLIKHKNVNSLYKINNGYDYMIEVVFPTVKEMEEFMEQLEENYLISDKKVYYVIDEIERESFLSRPADLNNDLNNYELAA